MSSQLPDLYLDFKYDNVAVTVSATLDERCVLD
jgi:hypothetical protein